MTCRPERLGLATIAFALVAALPALAAGGGDALKLAAEAIERGDGIAAEAASRRALEHGVPLDRTSAYMGEAELLQGNLAEAREWLGKGAFDQREWERGFHALARLEEAEGDLAAAVAAYERALEQGEGSAGLWVDFGRLRYRNGEHHRALDASIRALELDPQDPRVLQFRGQLIRDSQGLSAALPWFERALERTPDDVGLLGEYAATLGELGRYADMLAAARRMAEVDPGDPRSYYLQAVLAARAGHWEIARRLMWRSDGAYDEVPAGLLLAGVLELEAGNAALAVEKFDALLDLQPENRTARVLLGRALIANDEPNEAVARLRPLADRPDASPYVLALVGRALEHTGARQEAAIYLDRAAAVASTAILPLPVSEYDELAIFRFADQRERGDVARALLRSDLRDDNVQRARTLAARLLERYSGSADIEMLAGDVALLSGQAERALALYASAGKVRRPLPLVLRRQAALSALGRSKEANWLLVQQAIGNPQSADAARVAGRAAMAREDWPLAAVLLGRASRIGGGMRDPGLLADLARVQLQLGLLEEARTTSAWAYALHPDDPIVTATYAGALEVTAGDEAADVMLAKARELGATPVLARR